LALVAKVVLGGERMLPHVAALYRGDDEHGWERML
jgi:hypothetical protein